MKLLEWNGEPLTQKCVQKHKLIFPANYYVQQSK